VRGAAKKPGVRSSAGCCTHHAFRVILQFVSVTPAETVATLRQRSAEARRQAEIRASATREQTLAVVRALLPQEARAWLIGSLAWGGFGVRSDIDLVLSGVDGPRASEIETVLCEATGVAVDLLTFESLPWSFRERIEREGMALHGG
jgi:predicted nucleotidyltransferase